MRTNFSENVERNQEVALSDELQTLHYVMLAYATDRYLI